MGGRNFAVLVGSVWLPGLSLSSREAGGTCCRAVHFRACRTRVCTALLLNLSALCLRRPHSRGSAVSCPAPEMLRAEPPLGHSHLCRFDAGTHHGRAGKPCGKAVSLESIQMDWCLAQEG